MKPTLTADEIVRRTEWRPSIYHDTYKAYGKKISTLEVLSQTVKKKAMAKAMPIYDQLVEDVSKAESIPNWKPWTPWTPKETNTTDEMDETMKDRENKTLVNLTRTAVVTLYTRSAPRLLIEVNMYILKARAVASFARDQGDTDIGTPSASFIEKALKALGHKWMFKIDEVEYDPWVEIEKVFRKIESIKRGTKHYTWLCRYIKSSCETTPKVVSLYRLRNEIAKIQQLQILKRMKKRFELQESSTQLQREDLASLFENKLTLETCEIDKSLMKVLQEGNKVEPARTVVVVCPKHNRDQLEKLSKTLDIKDIVAYLQVGANEKRYQRIKELAHNRNIDSESQLRQMFQNRNQKTKQNVCLLDYNGSLLLKLRVRTFVHYVKIVQSEKPGRVDLYLVKQSGSNMVYMAVNNSHKIVQEFDYDSFTRGTAKYNFDPSSHYPYNAIHFPNRMNKNESGKGWVLDIALVEKWENGNTAECSTNDCKGLATYKLRQYPSHRVCDVCYQKQITGRENQNYINKRVHRFFKEAPFIGYVVREIPAEEFDDGLKGWEMYYFPNQHDSKADHEELTETQLLDTTVLQFFEKWEWTEIDEPQSFDKYEYILIMVDIYSGYVVLEKLDVAGAKDARLIADAFCRRPYRAICAAHQFRYDNVGVIRQPAVPDMTSIPRPVDDERPPFRCDVNEVIDRLRRLVSLEERHETWRTLNGVPRGLPKYCPSTCLCRSAEDCTHIAYKHMMQLMVTKVPLLKKEELPKKTTYVKPSESLLTKRATRSDTTSKKKTDDEYLTLLSNLIKEDHEREDKTDETFKESLLEMIQTPYHQIYSPTITKDKIKTIVTNVTNSLRKRDCVIGERCARDMRDNIDVIQKDFASDVQMTLKQMLDVRFKEEKVQHSYAGEYFDRCINEHLRTCKVLEETTDLEDDLCNVSTVSMDSELSRLVFDAIYKRTGGCPGTYFIQINKQTYNMNSTASVEGLIKLLRDCIRVYRMRIEVESGRSLDKQKFTSGVVHKNISNEVLQTIAETMNSMERQSRKQPPKKLFCQPFAFIEKELAHSKINGDAVRAFKTSYERGDEFNVKSHSRMGAHSIGNKSMMGVFEGLVQRAVNLRPLPCRDCQNKEIEPCKHTIPSIFNDKGDLVSRRVYIPKELQRASPHDVPLAPKLYSKKKKSST